MRARGATPTPEVERSFAVVRVVRGSLLLLAVVLACVGVEAKGWPHGVTLALAVVAVLLAGRLVADVRRIRASGPGAQQPPGSP